MQPERPLARSQEPVGREQPKVGVHPSVDDEAPALAPVPPPIAVAAAEVALADSHTPEVMEVLNDFEDLEAALKPAEEHSSRTTSLWHKVGPGLVTGAADNYPSGIGTYSLAGAAYGTVMLWLIPVALPLMIAVQEMCGRLASVTGKGLAAIIKEHYSRWLLYGVVLLLALANGSNIWADLNVMAASAQMLWGWSLNVWLVGATVLCLVLQIFVPYRKYVGYLKWLSVALFAYVVVVFLPGIHVHWAQVGHDLIHPRWVPTRDFTMVVVGFLGTTISPYLFFWQAGETVEERVAEGKAIAPGKQIHRATDNDIRRMRSDTAVGMVFSQGITFFIVVCGAAVLYAHGIHNPQSAQDAAKALMPLGPAAGYLFTVAIVGAGLLAIPTLAGSVAYALAETLGWRYGLYRPFHRARGFYGIIALITVIGFVLNYVSPVSAVQGLLYAAIVNGLVAPPLIVLLLFLCNNPRIIRRRRNGWASNLLGGAAALVMTLAGVVMLKDLFAGSGGTPTALQGLFAFLPH